MFETLLAPYTILDKLAATKKPCTIVADADILDAIKQRQTSEGARMLTVEHVMSGRTFTPQPGPYFVVTSKSEHEVKRVLRNGLAENGQHPAIYGALHDLAPQAVAQHDSLSRRGMEAAYEALRTQPAFCITCTPRSGSQHLAREMRNHMLGHPLEHIRPPLIELMKTDSRGRRFGDFDLAHWLASLLHHGTENGVFGTKLISHFVRDIDVHATPRERAVFDELLGRMPVIYLLRGNKMLQALSRDRAKATKSYHLFDEGKREQYKEKSQEWDYSFQRISREIQALYKEEHYLHQRILQVVPKDRLMVADYEDMDVAETVRFVELQLGVSAGKRQETLTTNVLRDDLTKAHAEAFMRDYTAAFKADDPTTHLPHQVRIAPESLVLAPNSAPAALALP